MSAEPDSPRGLALLRENVATVWANKDVRRLQLAFVGAETGGWAYAMALMVWAYGEGGAALVGVWAGVRMLLSAIIAPFGGLLADRMSRRVYMLGVDVICFGLVLLTALGIYLDLSMWLVLVTGTLSSIVGNTFRAAQGGLLPQLVDNPRQLTSANATAEIIDSTAQFVGPAIAGLLLGLVGVVPVVLLNALGFAWSFLLVAGVRRDTASSDRSDGAEEDEEESFLAEASRGFRVIAGDRDLLAVVGLISVNGVLAGMLNVLIVLVAAEMLGDPNQVGLLSAVLGIATFAGGFVMLTVAGRARLGRLMVFGTLGWCLSLVVIGAVPLLPVILAALVLVGLSDALVNVGFGTIPPRLVPDRVLSRVFAAIESVFIATCALGAFITPVLVSWLGLGRAVIAFGVVGTAAVLLCAIRIPHLDSRLTTPRGLELLRRVDLLRPLSPALLEQVAGKLEPVSVPAGEVVVSEGGVSDRFYVIETGEVEVSQADQVLRSEGPGEVFGEIGLLRDVPRTATVRATGDTELLTLSREDFLDLVSSNEGLGTGARELAARRLMN